MGQNRVDLVVKNGKLVSSSGIMEGGVAIDDGVIVTVGKSPHLPEGDRVVDVGGKVVLPGLIDGHSYTTLPPEDSTSGTRAAAKGGLTSILEMPGARGLETFLPSSSSM